MVSIPRIARTVLTAGLVMTLRTAEAQETPAAAPSASPVTPAASPVTPAASPVTPAASPSPKVTTYIGAPAGYRRETTWDLNLDGAIGSTLGTQHALTGFGRVRAGVLSIRDANVVALGVTYEYSDR